MKYEFDRAREAKGLSIGVKSVAGGGEVCS